MTSKTFRFGVVATPQGDGLAWQAMARRVADLGYSTLLMPDGVRLLSPLPALAAAAVAAPRLRVGTFVLAAPIRTPRSAAWEAHSLTVLTDGRFELGIGTGRPAARQDADRIGMPFGTTAQRLDQVRQAVASLRELDADGLRTPVLIAAGGPKSRELAAEVADIVTLATGPLASRDEVAAMAAELRALAGPRAGEIELAMNLLVVGDQVPSWTQSFIGADAATLIAHDSLVMLRGSTRQMADELQRRREVFGATYISVNAAFADQLAPVVDALAGR